MGGFDAGNGEDFAFGHSVGIFVEEIESVFEVGWLWDLKVWWVDFLGLEWVCRFSMVWSRSLPSDLNLSLICFIRCDMMRLYYE